MKRRKDSNQTELLQLREEAILLLCEMVEHCLDHPDLNSHSSRQAGFRAAIAAQRRAMDLSASIRRGEK